MTDHFLSSTVAGGANDGSSWANAWNLGTQVDWTAAAAAITVVGDRLIVSDDNATVLGADLNFTAGANHTDDNPLQVIVATPGAGSAFTPVSDYGASANGEIDGNNAYHFSPSGNVYFYGLRLHDLDATNVANGGNAVTYERCLLNWVKSGGETYLYGSPGSQLILIDSDINTAGNSYLSFNVDACQFRMVGGKVTTDGSATRLIRCSSGVSGYAIFSGVDMSGVNAATEIFTAAGANEQFIGRITNCSFPATMPTIYGGDVTFLDPTSDFIASGGVPYRMFAQYRAGSVKEETTIIRSGGADTGSQTYSFKVESTSTASRTAPLRHLLSVSNYGDLNGLAIKVHIASNTGIALKNDQAWIDVQVATSTGMYSGSSRNNLGLASSTYTDESGSEDWRNGGGALASYEEQSMSVSPGVATTGLVYVWLCVAADFTTTNNLYVCPKLDIA